MLERPVSFNEAMAMIDERLDRATALKYRRILEEWAPAARQRAFFSARVASATALSILHDRCRQVLEGDMTDAQAVRLIQEWFLQPQGGSVLASMGFAPVRDARGVAELASGARLALVVRTNVLMAQECGRYLAWKDMADAFPYGRWRCGHAEHHREEHLRRDGRVFRFDHPIWTQSPPGGEFNCRCRRELLTRRDLDRLGLVPEPDDFPFAPSSLGFDPSRPVSDTPVVPGAGVLPELAERALRPPAEPLPDPHLPFPRVDLGALVAATGQPADGAPPPGPASAIPGLAAEPPLIRPGDGDTPQTMRDRAAAWLRGHRDRLVAWVAQLLLINVENREGEIEHTKNVSDDSSLIPSSIQTFIAYLRSLISSKLPEERMNENSSEAISHCEKNIKKIFHCKVDLSLFTKTQILEVEKALIDLHDNHKLRKVNYIGFGSELSPTTVAVTRVAKIRNVDSGSDILFCLKGITYARKLRPIKHGDSWDGKDIPGVGDSKFKSFLYSHFYVHNVGVNNKEGYPLRCVVWHEGAHALLNQKSDDEYVSIIEEATRLLKKYTLNVIENEKRIQKNKINRKCNKPTSQLEFDISAISVYSTKNAKEFLAEAFTLMKLHMEKGRLRMPEELVALLRRLDGKEENNVHS